MGLLTQFASFFLACFGEQGNSEELNAFLKSHRIVNVEKRFVENNQNTGWAFLVEYGNEQKTFVPGTPKIDYKNVLSEQDYATFSQLRDLRKEIATRNASPVYTIFTNEQLVEMLKNPPKELKDFAKIKGVNETRVKEYAQEFINYFTNETKNM